MKGDPEGHVFTARRGLISWRSVRIEVPHCRSLCRRAWGVELEELEINARRPQSYLSLAGDAGLKVSVSEQQRRLSCYHAVHSTVSALAKGPFTILFGTKEGMARRIEVPGTKDPQGPTRPTQHRMFRA